jgi:hypothetical protein
MLQLLLVIFFLQSIYHVYSISDQSSILSKTIRTSTPVDLDDIDVDKPKNRFKGTLKQMNQYSMHNPSVIDFIMSKEEQDEQVHIALKPKHQHGDRNKEENHNQRQQTELHCENGVCTFKPKEQSKNKKIVNIRGGAEGKMIKGKKVFIVHI